MVVSLVAVEAPGGGGAPPDLTLDVRIFGSGYDDQSVAEFELAGTSVPDVTVNSTSFVSDSKLIANLTIGGTAVEAFYDVAVTNGRGKRGVGIELFEINSSPNGDPQLAWTLDDSQAGLTSDGDPVY